MPGIFGIINLQSRSSDQLQGNKHLFATMTDALRHHDDDVVEEAMLFDGQIIIGRIGLPPAIVAPGDEDPAIEQKRRGVAAPRARHHRRRFEPADRRLKELRGGILGPASDEHLAGGQVE